MNTMQEIIKKIMDEEGWRQTDLARRLGITKQALSQMLKRDDMMVDTAQTVLNALGYTLTARRLGKNE